MGIFDVPLADLILVAETPQFHRGLQFRSGSRNIRVGLAIILGRNLVFDPRWPVFLAADGLLEIWYHQKDARTRLSLRFLFDSKRKPPLAYTDFNLEMAESRLGVRARVGELFSRVEPAAVPDWLRDFLARGTQLALVSEKARSEFIVGPILLACRELSGGTLAIFSGQRLDVDPARGLIGECDFLLALSEALPRLRAVIVAMVEAKKNEIEAGLGQCVAQMVAARDFNDRDEVGNRTLHGCVTTGEAWQFLRLEDASVTIDRGRIYIDNVGAILGMFQAIIARSLDSGSSRPDAIFERSGLD